MPESKYPSASRLRQLFEYRDGKLFWRVRDLSEFISEAAGRYWNRRNSGNEAGCEARGDSGPRWMIRLGGFSLYRNVIVWKMHHGFRPAPPRLVDHKDKNTLNDRIENLRIGDVSKNMANSSLSSRNKSGYKGVNWVESRQKFQVYITVKKVIRFLGYFDDPAEGHAAYMKVLRDSHGEFASDGT